MARSGGDAPSARHARRPTEVRGDEGETQHAQHEQAAGRGHRHNRRRRLRGMLEQRTLRLLSWTRVERRECGVIGMGAAATGHAAGLKVLERKGKKLAGLASGGGRKVYEKRENTRCERRKHRITFEEVGRGALRAGGSVRSSPRHIEARRPLGRRLGVGTCAATRRGRAISGSGRRLRLAPPRHAEVGPGALWAEGSVAPPRERELPPK